MSGTIGSPAGATYRAGKRLWTAADEATLRQRYPDQSTACLARTLGRTIASVYRRARALGLVKSPAYLASPAAGRLQPGSTIGAATRFQAGQTPANHGLRRPGWTAGRMAETQFRKGARLGRAAILYQPIGTERLSKDGYLQRKVNDDLPLQRRWRGVHVILWEAAHGPVPAGHAVCFVNHNKRDIRLDNLALVPRRELMRRNSVHNLPAPLAQTIQTLGALTRAIRRKERTAHA